MTNEEFLKQAARVGGFAFPSTSPLAEGATWTDRGMSLRDWFAGMALQGILARPVRPESISAVTVDAYHYADAMLAERAK